MLLLLAACSTRDEQYEETCEAFVSMTRGCEVDDDCYHPAVDTAVNGCWAIRTDVDAQDALEARKGCRELLMSEGKAITGGVCSDAPPEPVCMAPACL